MCKINERAEEREPEEKKSAKDSKIGGESVYVSETTKEKKAH